MPIKKAQAPRRIAEAIESDVDEALRLILYLALDDGVESFARRLRAVAKLLMPEPGFTRPRGRLTPARELAHGEPARAPSQECP